MPLSDSLSFGFSTPAIAGLQTNKSIQVTDHLQLASSTLELNRELEAMSERLARTFEELSLIHDLSCHVDIQDDRTSHCRSALEKISGCVPASTLAIILQEQSDASSAGYGQTQVRGTAPAIIVDRRARPEAEVIQCGNYLDPDLIIRICEEMGHGVSKVQNHPLRCAPEINRVALVPMQTSSHYASKLLAISPASDEEVGTIEVQLMESVAMILKGHLDIHRQFEQMRQMFEGTVRALVSAIDAKDQYTCGHSARVSELAESLALDLGMSASEAETVRMSGLLHDIGKIGVSDAVLRKPGRLNDAEFDEIKKHPELGYRILCGVKQFAAILPGVRFHHESWDGRGYPQGLSGENIPMIARVLAVADAFDAMTSTRPYRNGMPIEQVEKIFNDGSGKQWDASIVDLLLKDRQRMLKIMHHQFEEL